MLIAYYPSLTPDSIRELTAFQFYTMLYAIPKVDRILGRSAASEEEASLPPDPSFKVGKRILGVNDLSKVERIERGKS